MEIAKVFGKDLGISTKHSIVVCDYIRGKKVGKAKRMLSEVIGLKSAVPFRKFNMDRGHKKGMMAGRFPLKCCKEMLRLLESAESNAKDKSLDVNSLFIKTIKADKASTPLHYGRFRSRKMKRTHVEIILGEAKKK